MILMGQLTVQCLESATDPLDIAGLQFVASFSFATCKQILCLRTSFSSFNHQGELLLYQSCCYCSIMYWEKIYGLKSE
ncbi:hypothetical protein P8452_76933 [Trifolium repens]|nr:hypothetical protein P8452_76933 [Trifolium repens]